MKTPQQNFDYDYVIVGSGFGGSVSALRLAEKGYRVLVLEKGKWLSAMDFPKTNWNVKRWFWLPALRFFGLFKLTFFRHVTVLSGVGVGGGSLVYANTLPVPEREFFKLKSWAHLADWETELKGHYRTALRMLGANPNPKLQVGDRALQTLAVQMKKEERFGATNVAVFFGEPEKTVPDPYFEGAGPERAGCTFCGGCMTGCRYDAKNSLDKNYLFLAQKKGAEIQAESKVVDMKPLGAEDGSQGYRVQWKSSTKSPLIQLLTSPFFPTSPTGMAYARRGMKGDVTCRGVIFAGGVLGTVPLLLKLKKSSLPRLSDKIGSGVRTNSEGLVGVTTFDKSIDFSEGIAIGSILHLDEHSHVEPVRYGAGSGFWRLLMSPMVEGRFALTRLGKIMLDWLKHPGQNFKCYFVWDWAKRTQILLIMRTLNSTLRFSRGLFGMKSSPEVGEVPTAFVPDAKHLAEQYAGIVNGKPTVLLTETILGIPTTAHILGGCVMGANREEGVIDKDNRVFGYKNMLICDGSVISANPGVNPALTITALSERAMSKIPRKPTANAL